MDNKLRKMAFWEIGGGQFGKEFQGDFEKAQDIASKRGVPVKCKAVITVYPEEKDNPNFSAIQFSTQITEPPKESIKQITLIQNGRIVKDGQSMAEILQYDLNLPDIKIKPAVSENVKNGPKEIPDSGGGQT